MAEAVAWFGYVFIYGCVDCYDMIRLDSGHFASVAVTPTSFVANQMNLLL